MCQILPCLCQKTWLIRLVFGVVVLVMFVFCPLRGLSCVRAYMPHRKQETGNCLTGAGANNGKWCPLLSGLVCMYLHRYLVGVLLSEGGITTLQYCECFYYKPGGPYREGNLAMSWTTVERTNIWRDRDSDIFVDFNLHMKRLGNE